MAVALAAPAVLLVEALSGKVSHGVAIAVVSAAVFTAVLARLTGVVVLQRRALTRERALRTAAVELVSATGIDQVHGTVRTGVAALLPPRTDHRVLLSVDAPAADAIEGPDGVLRCPLAANGHPDGRLGGARLGGELVVAAAEDALAGLGPAMQTLASQAALALQRIARGDHVNRRISEEYFQTLVRNSADVILIVDEGDLIRYASPSAERVLGHRSFVGARLLDLVHAADRERARYLLDAVLDGELSTEYADWTMVRSDGCAAEVEVSCRDLRADSSIGGLVLTLRDVTDRRRLEAELSHRALHDTLTGLANRVLFHDRTNRAIRHARSTGRLAGVLSIDLDDFKVVNDTLGHQHGDQLLVAVGRRLAGVTRERDMAARLGGDEFAVLVEEAANPGDIEQVAERVLEALRRPIEVAGEMLPGNASVGVAISADAHDAPDLLRQADLALYLAKREGKHQWRRYQPTLRNALLDRLELTAALEQAVADEGFVLHFQPIVELATGVPVGYEALLRWPHPQRGLLSPAEFMELAESTGLIVPIGSWVLRNALAALGDLSTRGACVEAGAGAGTETGTGAGTGAEADPYVAVNVSVRQFRAPDFVERVRRELARAGLPGRALMLEITESLLLRDDDRVWADLATLRALGIRIAIDDFGTGYSALSYLRQVPIDVLKIDRSFVASIAGSPQQAALVDGIIRLAHTLGLRVIAEGIEAAVERDMLLAMGARLGQGYLFARPMALPHAGWSAPRRGHRLPETGDGPGAGSHPRTGVHNRPA